MLQTLQCALVSAALLSGHAILQAEDNPSGGEWPQWGRDGSNNMMSPAKGLPIDFTSGEFNDAGEAEGAKHLKWVTEMGSQAYGTATVKDGRVFIGTNNEKPRLDSVTGDKGIVMCFDEKTGELLWQLSVPKLAAGKVSDWEFLGICSSVIVDGKYGYVITNRGEVLCLDVYGMSDGNDGFQDEAKYMNGGLEKLNEAEPAEVNDMTADIVWGYDMRSELGVFPHNVTSSSVVISDKYVFASTSNGVDWSHINIPAPFSPSIVALDKETGELVAEEAAGISEAIMHCNWSSPAYSEDLAGSPAVVFGAGDGFTYGFHATEFDEEQDGDETYNLFKELWKVDCCPQEYRVDEAGEPIKYATYPGPSEIISSPVIYNGKVYAAIGQDPEHGEGVGAISCIDPTKGTGEDAIVWQFKEVGRTISTPSVADGLVYIADYSGRLFCLDAETGEKYWEHDTLSHIWGSTLVVDGKVLLGNEDGELVILKAGKEYEELTIVGYPAPIYATPIVANGTLYVMTQTHLYAYEMSGDGSVAAVAP
ncbi:MAG: PQQ-binding-like beta-propeller repeat protein [Verrucomicrobiota bacterium]